MAEQKIEPKAGLKPDTSGPVQSNILTALGNAMRAYTDELHNAWVALNNASRDAQHELLAKITTANAAVAKSSTHERGARAHQTYMAAQQALTRSGSAEAWQQFKSAQGEYFEASKEASTLRDATQRLIDDANQEYTKSLRDARIEVQKRYDAAFRTFVAAQQAAFRDLDVNAVDPGMLIEIGRNLMQVGESARMNLARA
jgi:hypothetical protein